MTAHHHEHGDDGVEAPAVEEMPHDELLHWMFREVFRTDTDLTYMREDSGMHIEPRAGDVMDVGIAAQEEVERARDRGEFIPMHMTYGGVAVVDARRIVAIEVQLISPTGEKINDIQPGMIERDGEVVRDDKLTGHPE